MQPSRFRLRDAAAVAAFLALLLVAGRLNGSSLQSGEPAAADRAAQPRSNRITARVAIQGRGPQGDPAACSA